MKQNVIIVGAGAAGIAAAEKLAGAGCSVTILEARNRLGGRIWTVRDPALPIPLELGAEYIHGKPQATWETVQSAKLTPCEVPFEHALRIGRRLVDRPAYMDELNSALSGLGRINRDISFAEYLARAKQPSAFAKKIATDFVEGFDAADPARISAKSLAGEQENLGDVEEQPQFRLLEGYAALIDHMRSHFGNHARILMNHAVAEVRWRNSAVEVRCNRRSQVFRAARILLTLPVGILQLPPEVEGAVRFSPDIADKRRAANLLAPGAILKVLLSFREPFWERSARSTANYSFMHDFAAPFPVWWTARPLHLPLLTGWLGGVKAEKLSGSKPAAIKNLALQSLAGLMNIPQKKLRKMLAGFWFHDWPADPFTRGAYSYVTVGGSAAHRQLAPPIQSTLFFAGEAVGDSGQASTVAGAIASGRRAAREILATF